MSVIPLLSAEAAAVAVERERQALRAEVADLRHRIDVVLTRAAEVDPGDTGRLAVFVRHDLPTILRRSNDQH